MLIAIIYFIRSEKNVALTFPLLAEKESKLTKLCAFYYL
jgi:hypothetical protein